MSHLVVTGFAGTSLDRSTRRRLERLAPGGVVLFRRNVGTPAELRRLTRSLREVLGPRGLIAVDQEGGRVARLRAPFTDWPPMRRLGAVRSPALARHAGRALGRELAAAGFNLDFAPVLDVDSNPANPIIGDRAFGADPAVVGRLGVAFARGLEEGGVLACGKHFPGHGDTSVDSHLALPLVARTRRELARLELRPFRTAIRAGMPLLMTAHVLYPALDREHPATLSSAILRRLLRDRLGFAGAVVSDDLAMHALDGRGSVGDLAVASLAAGCDLLLACQSLEDGERAAEAIAEARRRRRIDPALFAQAADRVKALRARIARLPRLRLRLEAVLESGEGAAVLERLARLEKRRAVETTTAVGAGGPLPRPVVPRPARRARRAAASARRAVARRRSR